jgi:glycosyltransferase involved in cell wall biosynthesis
LKILIAHDVGRGRNGGMSRIMGLLHDDIAALGHQVEYLCSEDIPRNGLHPGLSRFVFPLVALRRAAEKARLGDPYDIVNVHEPSGAALVAWRSRLRGTKVVVTSHGVEERGWERRLEATADRDERPRTKTRILYPLTLLWQAAMALRRADHIFCLNTEDEQFVRSRYLRKSEDITRIFPGADPIYGRHAATRDYERNSIILFAGTWLIRKGIRDLVVAFTRLAEADPRLRLHVLNPGADPGVVLNDFPAHIRERVVCLRSEPEEGTARAMESADVFVLPSLFEGTPLTLMEAMGSGLPIVTTSICGMKDVITHETNGLLVPPHDAASLELALRRLLLDSELRGKLGSQAYADSRSRYQWKHCSALVMQTYDRLLSKSAVSSPELTASRA